MKKDYIDKCSERAKFHNRCPNCNCELTTVINGELWGEKAIKLRKAVGEYNLKLETFGVIYGDSRDFDYICRNCDQVYDYMLRNI